jgi:hypothetical protein
MEADGGAARVYDDVGDELAVEEGLDTEVEVGGRAGDGFPCVLMIGVYDSWYRWPQCSPDSGGANE